MVVKSIAQFRVTKVHVDATHHDTALFWLKIQAQITCPINIDSRNSIGTCGAHPTAHNVPRSIVLDTLRSKMPNGAFCKAQWLVPISEQDKLDMFKLRS